MSDGDLARTLTEVWAALEQGAQEPDAPARFLALATAGAEGGAEARMVVLRRADRGLGTLDIHTDRASAKIGQLRADPHATLLHWDSARRLQVRLRATATLVEGEPVALQWAALPPGAQAHYGGPPPGTAVRDPHAAARTPDPARFAILSCEIGEIETLDLRADPYLRALFRREDGFAGQWIAP